MFHRHIIKELEYWLQKPGRKPLVIRGARQVGKTTVVNQFAKQFGQYIYLNLETPADKQPFLRYTNLEELLQGIFFLKNQLLSKKANTLIFIDEIQEVPEALNILRYFHEQEPDIKVIAAGSMLETVFDKKIHFPVGRVEFKVLRPVSFPEFLEAMGEKAALEQLLTLPCRDFAHEKLLKLYHLYAIIGGMPEVVNTYIKTKDLLSLNPIFDSLIASYMDDVEKYAKNDAQVLHLRHIIRASFAEAGKRIHFAGFGNSAYRSREMGECFRILEKVLLLKLLYPNTSATLPFQPDLKKSPRLQILDTGMLNHFAGIQKDILGTHDLSSIYKGTVIEHLTGQELLANQYNVLSELFFWVKEKKTSTAEVDFVIPYEGKVIPIEVKSGNTGTLKSMHQFMEVAPHNMAIRFYAGPVSISEVTTPENKHFYLLNLPYYLVSQIKSYLAWFEDEIKNRQ
ncbi:MAG: ATP-binding protein [Sphingomonadales bacterium]|jgi:predicted AAA+ superfamily ATPase